MIKVHKAMSKLFSIIFSVCLKLLNGKIIWLNYLTIKLLNSALSLVILTCLNKPQILECVAQPDYSYDTRPQVFQKCQDK